MGDAESNGGLEFANSEDQITEWGGHPLFPRAETETGPDRRKFDLIHIQRFKNDGSREICPKAWRGSELRSWQQVVEAYGGGTYQLSAQCSQTFRFQGTSERVQLPGPSKSLDGVMYGEKGGSSRELPPEPMPVAPPAAMAAPMPPAPVTPGYAQSAPYPYPYAPPAPSGTAETIALVRAVIESSNTKETALMRALLERPGKETGSLDVFREILPMMQGMQGGNGTQALLQGVELARGLITPGNAAPPPPAQGRPEDDLALIGQVLRMIAPAAVIPAAAPAAPVSAPPATMTPPLSAAPPGCAWAYTATGWALVQLAQVQPYPVQMPAPAPAPAVSQPMAKPAEPATSTTTSTNPMGGLEDVLGDPEVGKLLASLSALGGKA